MAKMQPATYADLKNDIAAAIAKIGYTMRGDTPMLDLWNLVSMINRNRAIDGNLPGRILPHTGRPQNWLYKMGLNDTHIDTALRSIRKELSEGK
jgi:hypothetical protein